MDEIILKYLRNECSFSEKEQLFAWMEQSDENRKYFHHMRHLWDLHLLTDNNLGNPETTGIAYENVKRRLRLNSVTSVNSGFGRILRYAAVFALIGGTTLITYLSFFRPAKWIEINVPFGERRNVILPDSSVVCLNSASYFSYPKKFGENKRKVKLNGEGFFEVKHNPEVSFEVETAFGAIEVTGTKFNLYAYNQDSSLEASLLEGRIEFIGKEEQQEPLELKPHQKLIYNARNSERRLQDNIDVENAASWMNGIYNFDNVTFGELLGRLEKLYNVHFRVLNTNILNYEYTGKFREGEDVLDIMKVINATMPFNYKKEENRITIY